MTGPAATGATVLYSVAEPDPDAPAVRSDLEWVGRMLRESLDRQEGPGLSALVQEVQQATRGDWPDGPADGPADASDAGIDGAKADARLAAVLAGVDLPTEILLVRAFSAWFHLANVVQQVHQARHLERTAGRGGRLAEAVDRIEAEGVPSTLVDDVVRRLELRPVFTSHPTQAARRSVLSKMRQVAELLRARQDAASRRAGADRAPLRRGGRPAVADRRAAPGQARAVGGGQLHPVPPPGAVPGGRPRHPGGPGPGAVPPGSRARRRRPPPPLRHLGRAATGTGTPTSPPRSPWRSSPSSTSGASPT